MKFDATVFKTFVLSPADFSHAGLAIAGARAGGVGILDLEFSLNRAQAQQNWRALVALVKNDQQIGLRMGCGQLKSYNSWLKEAAKDPYYLILSYKDVSELKPAIKCLPTSLHAVLLVEVRSRDEYLAIIQSQLPVDGFVVCGQECGGRVGDNASYILTQKILQERSSKPIPIYIRGGVGVHTGAACRSVGASGIVLDDQLLLMPESPLSADQKSIFRHLNGKEAQVFGERLGAGYRFLNHPIFAQIKAIKTLEVKLENECTNFKSLKNKNNRVIVKVGKLKVKGTKSNQLIIHWNQEILKVLHWGDTKDCVWPVGQGIGLAAALAKQYKTTGRLIQAIQSQAHESLKLAHELKPLSAQSPMARSHGTEYPIIQGPMTRVSDCASFAKDVAHGGGLPMLALALMRGPQIQALLHKTQALLGDKPWGVGILGFVPAELRQEQIQEILQVKPAYAIIAGGRPDQAKALEEQGIPAYLHVPTPTLLQNFIKQGARRFIFEGRECGGHVGPLSSFVLWEQMIAILLQNLPKGDEDKFHLVFAGGIHNAPSAAMIATMTAPLVKRGCKIGILMGTAYLFTSEAVKSGAIVDGFQKTALSCENTVNLISGVGHANRCADSAFAKEFYQRRRQLLQENDSSDEIRQKLDELLLGRLRIAAKGLKRTGDDLKKVTVKEQNRDGMYMIGEVATLRDQIVSIQDLHEDVSVGSQKIIDKALAQKTVTNQSNVYEEKPSEVAIIGIATLLPQAENLQTFWKNLLDKKNVITEVPQSHWDWRLYYDGDKKAPDKSYSRWGGFFDDVIFDPLKFGIPPNSIKYIGASQLLALEMTHRALKDAGYDDGDFDREHTSTIIANSDSGGFLGDQYQLRSLLPLFSANQDKRVLERMTEWNEVSFSGILTNIVAGRVANRFDLGGANFTVDAACASSLIALNLGVRELENKTSNLVIAGGVAAPVTPDYYIGFSKTQALSPTGEANVFDKDSDGIVLSDGIVVMVLKRLADAERDGDKIYAVIKSVAESSDGKAMGMTAPRPLGQMRALDRAYSKAGFSPATLGFYEAHATGTKVGDKAELETISTVMNRDGAATQSCAIGSIKNSLGHTTTAAGFTSLSKAVLSLHHKVLPPQDVKNPLDEFKEGPVYLLDQAKPWLKNSKHPRRVGVSSFGFGGTNAHVVLEEYQGQYQNPALGATHWPCELIVLQSDEKQDLINQVQTLRLALSEGAKPKLHDLAYSLSKRVQKNKSQKYRAAMVVKDLDGLQMSLDVLEKHLTQETPSELPNHILLSSAGGSRPGKLAFLFPGQGAQYVSMAREVALYFKEFRDGLEYANEHLDGCYHKPLGDLIYPATSFTAEDKQQQEQQLTQTHVAQPAIGVVSTCYFQLATRLGLQPDMVCGHSYGEFTALFAAGVLSHRDFLDLSEMRGQVMAKSCEQDGAMAAVCACRETVEQVLKGQKAVVFANHNGPEQTVISGERQAVKTVVKDFEKEGIRCIFLPVAGAFHSPLMQESQQPLSDKIAEMSLQAPSVPVYSNTTAGIYPTQVNQIKKSLQKHLLSPVEFVGQIENMYKDGARVFVEMGPGRRLSSLLKKILGDRNATVISFDGNGDGLQGFVSSLAQLFVAGVSFDVSSLYQDRQLNELDLKRLLASTKEPEVAKTAWLINSMHKRPFYSDKETVNELPLLNFETYHQERRLPGSNEACFVNNNPDSNIASVYNAYQKTMRQFLKMQEDIVSRFLDGDGVGELPELIQPMATKSFNIEKEAEQSQTQKLPQPEKNKEVQNTKQPSQGNIAQQLIQLVAEKTGYPEDMLGLDQDMEAELGIDSIKRVEILEAVGQIVSSHLAGRLKDQSETLTRIKTLKELIDSVVELSNERAPASVSHGETTARQALESRDRNTNTAPIGLKDFCPRYVMGWKKEALPTVTLRDLEGLFLITQDEGTSKEVSQALKKLGASPVIIGTKILNDRKALTAYVAKQRAKFGKVRGILHLTGLKKEKKIKSLKDWRSVTQANFKACYHLIQLCAQDLQADGEKEKGRILVASVLGGYFGRQGAIQGTVAAGFGPGLLKSLEYEFKNTVFKSLDFDTSLSDKDRAFPIVQEILMPGGVSEVGYPDGERTVFYAVREEIHEKATQVLQPESDWVVLITGGARGITAKVAQEIVKPGMRLVIVGRSRVQSPESSGIREKTSANEIRKYFLDEAKKNNQTVTPVEIEKRVRAVLKEREIEENLNRMREKGAQVDYVAQDVRTEAFGDFITSIYQKYGRLDGVIHGAGLIEDKLLVDKSFDSVDRVFDTKVDSLFLLAQHLKPESLKLFVLFSSVAGRFGNRGQGDYAAANEVMNRFAYSLRQQWQKTRIISFNWGPWQGSGMASEAVNQQFKARGIIPISTAAGLRFFTKEITHGPQDIIEVVAGKGTWGEPQKTDLKDLFDVSLLFLNSSLSGMVM